MDDQPTELPVASPRPQPSVVQDSVLVHELEEARSNFLNPEHFMPKILLGDQCYLCWASFLSQAPTPDKNLVEFVTVMGEPENSSTSEESPERSMF